MRKKISLNRLPILILISSALPVLKQLYILKYLDASVIGLYGFLFATASFFVGFSHLGWTELTVIKAAQKRSIFDREKFFLYGLSSYHILLVNLTLLPIALIIQNISPSLFFFVIFFVIAISFFQLQIKIVRSYRLIKLFFIATILKNFIDLIVFFALHGSGFFNIKTIFLTELMSALFLIFRMKKIKAFKKFNIPFFIGEGKLFLEYYSNNKHYAFNIFLVSLLSLLFSLSDRVLYYYVLSENEYTQFLFYLIIVNLFFSVNALLHTILYASLSRLLLENKAFVLASIDKVFFKVVLFCLGLPIMVVLVYFIQVYFYEHISSSLFTISLFFVYGFLIVVNIYEKYNLLSKDERVKYVQVFVILMFFLGALFLYQVKAASLVNLTVMSIFLRAVYLVLNRELIRRKI